MCVTHDTGQMSTSSALINSCAALRLREETRERERARAREREIKRENREREGDSAGECERVGERERPDLCVEALVILLLGLANAEDRLQPLSYYV